MISSRKKITSLKRISPFLKSDLKGVNGLDGKDGLSITGDKGERGYTGDKGERGLQGLKGETGAAPQHNWSGTTLSFQNPDGTWGEEVDLKGDKGDTGESFKQDVTSRIFSTSIDNVKGLRSIINSLLEENMQYDKLVDTVGDYKYIGEVLPGTTKSTASWRIKRVDLSDTGGDIDIVFADGTSEFSKVWDDRLSYDYVVES